MNSEPRQELAAKWEERHRLARAECAAGRRPANNPRIAELDAEIKADTQVAIAAWDAAADMSGLDAEEQIRIPRSVFDLLLLHFESGLTRGEQLRCAWDGDSLAHLAAIKLCFDGHDWRTRFQPSGSPSKVP